MTNPSAPAPEDLTLQLAALRQQVADLKALDAERQRALEIQAALYRIADIASAAENMATFYAALHRVIGTLMDARNFFIALYDETTHKINFPFYVDEVDTDLPAPTQWFDLESGLGNGLTAYVLRTGQPLLAPPEKFRGLVAQRAVEAVGADSLDWLGVPLKSSGHTLGVLVVQSYSESVRFGEEEKSLLTFVSHHVATAFERARQFNATREHLVELAVIASLREALATQLKLNAVVELVGEKIRAIFDAQVVFIALYDTATQLIRFPYYWVRGEHLKVESRPLGTGLTSIVIQTREPLLLNTQAERRAQALGAISRTADETKSWLGVPILAAEEVVGVISLQHFERENLFSDADVRLVKTMGESLWMAIENARLFESIEQRVTERTRELAEANERLKELDQLKSQFVSNVSHELRTPLTNISLYLALLAKHHNLETLDRTLPVLKKETDRLKTLVEEVLTLSRIEQGQITFAPRPCALDDLLAEVIAAHIARAEAKHLTLTHTRWATLPPVMVDPAHITQVFTNLVGNAVAYTPPAGAITITTTQRTRATEPDAPAIPWGVVTFHNTGPAIPPEDLPHIFERFYRGRTGYDSGEHGTGLGLAICLDIIERHKGYIEVQSAADEGTTFTVWLPLI